MDEPINPSIMFDQDTLYEHDFWDPVVEWHGTCAIVNPEAISQVFFRFPPRREVPAKPPFDLSDRGILYWFHTIKRSVN